MEKKDSQMLFGEFEFWNKLTETEKNLLENQLYPMVYQEGQYISSTGMDCLGLFLVEYGTLRVYLVSEEGKEVTVFRMHEGELCMISGSCMLSSFPFEVQIDAETETKLYLLPTSAVKKVMEKNIYMENFVYKMMNENLSDIIAAVQKMLFASLEQRIAEFLLDESVRRKSAEIMMTQEQIARSIGSAREAVSRILKQMVKDGSVELFRGGVRMLDKKKLYKIL